MMSLEGTRDFLYLKLLCFAFFDFSFRRLGTTLMMGT
jgi:hypothetical protein